MLKGLLLVNSIKYTLDRYENDLAVFLLKDDESFEKLVPTSELPETIKEGDIVEMEFADNGSIIMLTILRNDTQKMKSDLEHLINKLKNK